MGGEHPINHFGRKRPSQTVSHLLTIARPLGINGQQCLCLTTKECSAQLDISWGRSLAPNPIQFHVLFETENRHGPRTAAKSEIAVTHIQIPTYYSTLIQTNVSLLRTSTDGGNWTYNNYDCQNFQQIFTGGHVHTLSYISNTLFRESPKFQKGFHVSYDDVCFYYFQK